MTALDEFKGRVWQEAKGWIADGYDVTSILEELGVTKPDVDDAEVKEFKERLWRVTAAAADNNGWCSDWEYALNNLDMTDPGPPVEVDHATVLAQLREVVGRLQRTANRL